MSKEFQIRDGNLIASFDLENEDDIDLVLYEEIDKQINELKGRAERSRNENRNKHH